MKRTIIIPCKPMSINAVYCKQRSWTTAAYKEWSAQVFHRLDNKETLQAFKDLREFFDPSKHGYSVSLKFYYPREILFTKKGALSARAHDLSNIEKPIIDLLFLPQFFTKPSPYGIQNLNIDDKFIYELESKKLPDREHRIEIELSIIVP